MAVDLYLRLGVNRDADKDSIKKAYRKIAKSCHPDMDGECGNADRFRDLQEAYETLSDAEKRKAYDARLESDEGESVPVHRRTPAPRADAMARPSGGRRRADDLWTSYFSGIYPSYADGRAPVHLEAILSPEEASEGQSVTLPIEVVSRCPWCGDAFPSLLGRRFRCANCRGTGRICQRRHLPFHIPAGVRHGSILALTDPDLPDGRIRVRILIDR